MRAPIAASAASPNDKPTPRPTFKVLDDASESCKGSAVCDTVEDEAKLVVSVTSERVVGNRLGDEVTRATDARAVV